MRAREWPHSRSHSCAPYPLASTRTRSDADLHWWREGTPQGKKALVAASLGWMLDSFDVMLYALVLPELMVALSLDRVTSGSLQSVTLLAAAAGGLFFGVIADRYGRRRALMCERAALFDLHRGVRLRDHGPATRRVPRLLGLGMGGEWASGATLVSESWPERHRGKALAFMQSSWAIGYALATLTSVGRARSARATTGGWCSSSACCRRC